MVENKNLDIRGHIFGGGFLSSERASERDVEICLKGDKGNQG